MAVADGTIAVGGKQDDEQAVGAELFDEESGRWMVLPHPMALYRHSTCMISVLASALSGPAKVVGAMSAREPTLVGSITIK